jgi:DNA-binding CsgD family transcriptional regulator
VSRVSTQGSVYDDWVDLVVDLSRGTAEFPRAAVADRIAETFCCHVSWNWAEPDGSFGFELHGQVTAQLRPEDVQRWAIDGMRAHPLLLWFAHTRDPLPMTVGRVPRELVPPRGWAYLRECLEEPGWEQQLSIPHHLGPTSYRAMVLAQACHDFSDEQLDLARRLQPLLAVLDRQAEVLARTRTPSTTAAAADLTCREVAVLRLLGEGMTAAAIGRRLLVSTRTVHTHLGHIYRKLGVSDRLLAVLAARELGLVPAAPLQHRSAGRPLSGRSFAWPGPRLFGEDADPPVVATPRSDVVDDHVQLGSPAARR